MTSQEKDDQAVALTLHDYLSLGEVEKGLETTSNQNNVNEEIQRLPLLLRLLSATRNLVQVSILSDPENSTHGKNTDSLLYKTVDRLEHVAAVHSVSEVVDVVTCYLAPTLTTKLSRVPPLKRQGNGSYITKELQEVARDPKGLPSSRKRQKVDGGDSAAREQEGEDESDVGAEDLSDVEDTVKIPDMTTASHKRKRGNERRRTSLEVAAEDSQEATVVKTLSELISLVVLSLDPTPQTGESHHDDNEKSASDEANPHTMDGERDRLVLTIDDSILAETGREGSGGAMEFNDLGSTIAALLHCAPALQSQHIANALCRASVPQIGDLMGRIGANCPTVVPLLLTGCIQAYKEAIKQPNLSIINATKQGVLSLAKLSPRELRRVQLKLQSSDVMLDIQLDLALQSTFTNDTLVSSILIDQSLKVCAAFSAPEGRVISQEQTAGEDSTGRYEKMDEDDHTKTAQTEPNLRSTLPKRAGLFKKTLEYFAGQFQDIAASRQLSKGRLLLLLKGFSSLLLVFYPIIPPKHVPRQYLLDVLIPAMKDLLEKVIDLMLEYGNLEISSPTSPMDSLFQSMYCAIVLLICRALQGGSETMIDAPEKCREIFALIGDLPGRSHRMSGLQRGIESSLVSKSPSALYSVLAMSIGLGHHDCPSPEASGIREGQQLFCHHFQELRKSHSSSFRSFEDIEVTLYLFLHQLKQPHIGTFSLGDISDCLNFILTSEMCQIPHAYMLGDLVPHFVSEATKYLVHMDGLLVPFVASTSLEKTTRNGKEKSSMARFLIQLLHALEYRNEKPLSPFVVDPRSVPLNEALMYISTHFAGSVLGERVNHLIGIHAEESVAQVERHTIAALGGKDVGRMLALKDQNEANVMLYKMLRTFVLGDDSGEDSECTACEGAFLATREVVEDSVLYCTVCSAFLASPHIPKTPISYTTLLNDPLVLIKCPLRVWQKRGLRRVALMVLSALLESNAIMVRNSTPIPNVAAEFIASRDLIVVRALLVCLTSLDQGMSSSQCVMTSGIIRSMIAAHRGLVAAMIRQGVAERALDWLVENVPECMNDSSLLLQLLSDRNSLTAAERLIASDAVLRIAIVQGQNDEDPSAMMAYAALTQLVDSFFLVLGPVDVPVNSLIMDDSGLDITQISRRAAFRILKAMSRIRGKCDALRRRCAVPLQKLAALCKSESAVTGLGGAVAGRRKALLKELYDLLLKVSSNLGVGGVVAQAT